MALTIKPYGNIAHAVEPHSDAPGWTPARWRLALLLLAAAALALRATWIGYPLIDVDEQFYLLVGDRMWGGAIPYVDIWDRKPVGLFLLYAACRLLGGDGIVAYQVVSAIFVAATAVVIACTARQVTSPGAALVAGFAYVPALTLSGGGGGQTPIFYNLPMAAAALILVDIATRPMTTGAIRWRGTAAMTLVGLALQIKYTAVFEGMFFGCALLWCARRAGRSAGGLLADAILWISAALLPTAAAFAAYWSIGEAPAFLYANFWSIAARGDALPGRAAKDLLHTAVRLLPFVVPLALNVALSGKECRRTDPPAAAQAYRFVSAWTAAAGAGYLIFGGYFPHYALPLLPPLAIAAAPGFAIAYRRIGRICAVGTLLALLVPQPFAMAKQERRHGDGEYIDRLAAAIRPHLNDGCLYVFYGEPILYHLTGSCLPTRWPFPYHLGLSREAAAIGTDPVRETARILVTSPAVIVDTLYSDPEINPATARLVRARLSAAYRIAAVAPTAAGRGAIVYVRKPERPIIPRCAREPC